MPVQLICCSHSPLMTTGIEETEQGVQGQFFRELDSCAAALHKFNPDLVVVFAGTDYNNAGEGRDRGSLAMPGNYGSLIRQVTALGNPRTVLVIQSAGPVRIDSSQAE